MKETTTAKLKEDLCHILDTYAEDGITGSASLSDVKTALSALQKLQALEAMACLQNGSYSSAERSNGERSFRRDARGRYCDSEQSGHGLKEKMERMLKDANADEREVLRAFLQQL